MEITRAHRPSPHAGDAARLLRSVRPRRRADRPAGTHVDGPGWSLRRRWPLQREARLDAVRTAVTWARDHATALGATLGDLLELSDTDAGSGEMPRASALGQGWRPSPTRARPRAPAANRISNRHRQVSSSRTSQPQTRCRSDVRGCSDRGPERGWVWWEPGLARADGGEGPRSEQPPRVPTATPWAPGARVTANPRTRSGSVTRQQIGSGHVHEGARRQPG
ncbi:MAG: SIMPL domain-containing protein [Janthinobacterium lividum]